MGPFGKHHLHDYRGAPAFRSGAPLSSVIAMFGRHQLAPQHTLGSIFASVDREDSLLFGGCLRALLLSMLRFIKNMCYVPLVRF